MCASLGDIGAAFWKPAKGLLCARLDTHSRSLQQLAAAAAAAYTSRAARYQRMIYLSRANIYTGTYGGYYYHKGAFYGRKRGGRYN